MKYLLLLFLLIPILLHSQDSLANNLQSYKELYEQGLITKDEYEAAKRKALGLPVETYKPEKAKKSFVGKTNFSNITELGIMGALKRPLFSVKTIFGGRPNPHLYVGGGLGFNYKQFRSSAYKYSHVLADLFADLHYFILSTRVSPFLALQAGPGYYSFATSNVYVPTRRGALLLAAPSVGVRGYISPDYAMGLSLGYRFNHFFGYEPFAYHHLFTLNLMLVFG